MADETKAPPAPIVVAPQELVTLYETLQEREWNINAYKNPVNVMRSLVAYGKVGALRIVDAFRRIVSLEARVAVLEKFKADFEQQVADSEKQLEAMLKQQGVIAADHAVPVATPASVAAPSPVAPVAAAPAPSALTIVPAEEKEKEKPKKKADKESA